MAQGNLKMLACRLLVLWLSIAGVHSLVGIPSNAIGTTDENTVHRLGHALNPARLQSRTNTYSMDRTSLAKSWDGATLFTTGTSTGIKIVCSTCYVNGSVTGELILNGNSNFTETVDEVWDNVSNKTEAVFKTLENYTATVATDISTFQVENIPSWPTIDVDFDLGNVTGLPEAQVHFEFDDLEIYLDLDIQLSAESTYTINIFTSETVAGISVPGLAVGAVFSVDLILIADANIDITSGIHVKLDDGLSFDMGMFNSNMSAVTVPGGSFEFLPVTIQGGSGSIQAIISLQASLGVDMDTQSDAKFKILSNLFSLSAGIQTDIFAYVADFALQVNHTSTTDEEGCDIVALAEYTMALGAAAGATAAVNSYTWGPAATTTVPVWYTTLASMCATSKTSSASATITARAELDIRDDVSTTAVSTTEAFTMVTCSSSGLVNCPANLQYTTSYKRTLTTDVTVQSGAKPTFPASSYASVTSAIPFGTNVRRLAATSGSPTSYTPTSSSTSKVSKILDGSTNGASNKLIIGLCVGLGLPFLIAIGVGISFCIRKRRRYSSVATQPESVQSSPPSTLPTVIINTSGTMHKSPLLSQAEQ